MNKPLAQGLLLGKYDPNYPPEFCAGDHRRKKSWFRADALSVIDRRLQPLKDRFGDRPQDLARVALQYCLAMSQTTCTVVGFSRQSQLTQNMEAIGRPLSSDDVAFIDSHMSGIAEEIGTYFASEAGGSHGPRSL